MATELRKTELTIDVVLGQKVLRLQEVRNFEVGQTFALNISPDDPLELQSGGITLGRAQIGQRRNNIAVRMLADMFKDIAR